MDQEFSIQVSEAIEYDKLFDNSNPNDQVTELRKVLLLADINLNVDLYDEELMKEIHSILEKFDPNDPNIEDQLEF